MIDNLSAAFLVVHFSEQINQHSHMKMIIKVMAENIYLMTNIDRNVVVTIRNVTFN